MSDNRNPEGDRVYCHQCTHEWDRTQGGLTCPSCGGEFVEIRHSSTPPPVPPHPLRDHNPWGVPDPDEGDIRTYTFGGGRGRVAFTSRTYTSMNGGFGSSSHGQLDGPYPGFSPFGLNQHPAFSHGGYVQEGPFARRYPTHVQPANLQDVFSMVFQTMSNPHYHYQQAGIAPPGSPFGLLSHMMNPSGVRPGDAAMTQEQFDRIMTQLMDQNNVNTAPGPASDNAIQALPKKIVEKDMLDEDGKAECSICMDGAELGDEVTNLPCKHWFHRDCVVAWLKEHDTCPHCRAPISSSNETAQTQAQPQAQRPEGSRRRLSRRQSSMSSPPPPPPDHTRPNRPTSLDTPSGSRDLASSNNDNRRYSDHNRSSISRQTTQSRPGGSNGRDVDDGDLTVGQALSDAASWIRNRFPFGR